MGLKTLRKVRLILFLVSGAWMLVLLCCAMIEAGKRKQKQKAKAKLSELEEKGKIEF